MIIGIDGNEANVKDRVGSGTYAFELLKQFHSSSLNSSSWRERQRPIESDDEILSLRSRMTRRNNHQFIVYLKDSPLPDLPKESANFKYKAFGPKKLWTQFALPIKLMFGRQPDVFFSMAHYGPRFSKVPYVVTIHDLSYLHYPELFKKSDLLQLRSWTKYSVQNATHIIAVSQTTKDDIVKNYHVDPAKITVTYEGYDQSRIKPQSESQINRMKKKYQIDGNYIIFVGTLQPRKNLERLIEAFATLMQRVPRALSVPRVPRARDTRGTHDTFDTLSLVIVGKKGWLYDSIFQKVKDLNVNQRVIFTNYVPDDDLPALISGAKAYILPSLWEGFGIPVVEAQACGVPVVVSNTSSLPEIVRASTSEVGSDFSKVSFANNAVVSDSAVLINPESVQSIASGIKKALDPKIRSDLIKKGFTNIKRFSWGICAQQTLKILEKVGSE